MSKPLPANSCIGIGIDVGGPSKGFHAAALRDGCYWDKLAAPYAALVAMWCQQIGARVVGIDAPCSWSVTGQSRSTERALAAECILLQYADPGSRQKQTMLWLDVERGRAIPYYQTTLSSV